MPTPPDTLTTPAPHKLYRLVGEHVQAWCSAISLKAVTRLLEQHLEPSELSATDLREVPEDEWADFGISKASKDSPCSDEARLLSLKRGDFH